MSKSPDIMSSSESLNFTAVRVTLTNVNSCFLFVPSQDPDLDVRLHQSLDGFWHFILELVFDGGGPEQLQVLHQK